MSEIFRLREPNFCVLRPDQLILGGIPTRRGSVQINLDGGSWQEADETDMEVTVEPRLITVARTDGSALQVEDNDDFGRLLWPVFKKPVARLVVSQTDKPDKWALEVETNPDLRVIQAASMESFMRILASYAAKKQAENVARIGHSQLMAIMLAGDQYDA